MPVEIEHKDKLGQPLTVGACVAYPSHNNMVIGVIKKINPKMLTVFELGVTASQWYSGSRKYPSDLVLLQGPEVTMYLLRHKG